MSACIGSAGDNPRVGFKQSNALYPRLIVGANESRFKTGLQIIGNHDVEQRIDRSNALFESNVGHNTADVLLQFVFRHIDNAIVSDCGQ